MRSKLFLYNLFLICISFQSSCDEYEQDHDTINEYGNKSIHKAVENGGNYAPMANLEGEPSAFVHGCVNVITGQYCEFNTDLVVYHGIDPLKLERSFAGNTFEEGTLGGGWQMNHQSRLLLRRFLEERQVTKYCLFEDDHGSELYRYRLYKSDTTHFLPNKTLAKGVTNTARGFISAQTNLRNLKYTNEKIDILKKGKTKKRKNQ